MANRSGQIKNRAPATIQITAEQLLREAQERGIEAVAKAPRQFITDKEELVLYQQSKRKEFEDQLRRQRQNIGIWCKYGLWEASQLEFERARSVFERALDVDYRNQTIWLKYAEMEMKNKFINHARNIWDRAVTLLPRLDSFWYKYTYMEEMIGAIDNARQVFERWMSWEPDDLAWAAFIKFEVRQGEISRARSLFDRYVKLWPTCRAYLKYSRWEEEQHEKVLARTVYERSLQELHPQEKSEKLIINFARFEERCKEFDRARVIYQFAIKQLSELKEDIDITDLKKEYLLFEKRHGTKEGIEDALVKQKREHYSKILANEPFNYDAWFDYIRLEESEGSDESARSIYERAILSIPLAKEKRHWKRYIYLWVYYALFEELQAKSIDNARSVYQRCLDVIPHQEFTFGKIWVMAADLEVRVKDISAARKILGKAIGMTGKENIYKGYIDLELRLGEIDRCRVLYSKYVASMPHNCSAWKSFAQMESSLGESTRARKIYELAVNQSDLDMPELLWKSYIDFELKEGEIENARQLYERLLEKTSHVKAWISFAKFEFEADSTGLSRVRAIFKRAYDFFKSNGLKEERVLVLEAWKDIEIEALKNGFEKERSFLSDVESKFPTRVNKTNDLGESVIDYLFPDDQRKPVGMKLLEKAMAWRSSGSTELQESLLGKRSHDEEETHA